MNSQTNQVFVSQSVNGPFAIDAKAYLTSKMRKVTLSDEITSESIESLITICELLIQESESSPITLYFNTPGGSVNAAYHLIVVQAKLVSSLQTVERTQYAKQ